MKTAPSRLASVLCAFASLVARPADGQEQHWKASYRLDFSYDPSSSRRNGPQSWFDVDVTGNEWEDKYAGGDVHDVRLRGNVCAAAGAGAGAGDESSRHRPSPLALVPTEDCTDTSQIVTRPLRSSGGDCAANDWDFALTPLGLRAYPPDDTDASCDVPQLRLPGTRHPDPWDLRYLEVHVRSEHVLDGRRFDAELQMYHFGRGDDAYAAVGVAVVIDASAGRDHVEFEYMLRRWEGTRDRRASECAGDGGRRATAQVDAEGDHAGGNQQGGSTTERKNGGRTRTVGGAPWEEEIDDRKKTRRRELQDDGETATDEKEEAPEPPCEPERDGTGCEPYGPRRLPFPYSLWPSIWYYRYRGSMTSPPCSDIVHWRVLDEPLRISKGQLRRLVGLTNAFVDEDCNADRATSPKGENFRPLQSRNVEEGRQEVQHCTSDHFRHTMYAPEDQ